MNCVLSGHPLNRGRKVNYIHLPTYFPGTPQNSSRSLKDIYVFKAPLFLEDIYFALAAPTFAHEKIHHCVYKCQIAMQIGICVPNYPFCVFAKRMCLQILQVWVGSLLESWLPLSQHQIRCCLLTVRLRGQSFNVVPGVDSKWKVPAERKTKQINLQRKKNLGPTIYHWAGLGRTPISPLCDLQSL